MLSNHRDIQRWIMKHYGIKYNVEIEIDGQNYLPDRERHWYQPDVILRDKKGEIRYIIEIENDPVRKALVGASVLADYSLAQFRQKAKPRLIFVIYSEIGIKQIKNFKEKLKIAGKYCKQLKNIKVYPESDFKELKL
jgi:hypothetical protein